jgi:hypothetical protein
VPNAEVVAVELEKVFATYPHWQVSGHQEREVRRALYRVLLQARAETGKASGVKETSASALRAWVERLIRIAERAGGTV